MQIQQELPSEFVALLEQCPQKQIHKRRLVVCPRCNEVGRAGQYHPTCYKDTIIYYVAHHNIAGTWGNSRPLRRYKRCYMRKGHENDIFVAKMKREQEMFGK